MNDQRRHYQLVANIDVPKVSGVEGCGAQALAAVMAHLDPSHSAADLANELPWHDVGATPIDLLLEARHRGFDAAIARGTLDALAENLNAGQPVLVMLDSGMHVRGLFMRYPTPRVMHWSVVSGIAADQSRVLLAAEDHRHHIASRDDFLQRWSRSDNCMIVVTPPRRAVQSKIMPIVGTGEPPPMMIFPVPLMSMLSAITKLPTIGP